MEEESKRIMKWEDTEREGMKKEEEEKMMGYCLLMKYQWVEYKTLSKEISEYVMKRMEEGGEKGKEMKKELKVSLGLRGICEQYCLLHYFLFLISSTILSRCFSTRDATFMS
jgi:hypothetical protein